MLISYEMIIRLIPHPHKEILIPKCSFFVW